MFRKIAILLAALLILPVFAAAQNQPNQGTDCQNLFWFDNDNKNCEQKQFCGAYMYQGLQTFESKGECLNTVRSLEKICTKEYAPVCCSIDGEEFTTSNACMCEGQVVKQGECSARNNSQDSIFCTEEAKLCPDGSYVARNSSNNCQFDPCPNQNQNRNQTKFQLSNGRNAEIKVMPETAAERARERLGELGFNITLKEVGQGNETRAAYHAEAQKEFRILGLIKKQAKVQAEIDAETGEVISSKKPWWAFIASEDEL